MRGMYTVGSLASEGHRGRDSASSRLQYQGSCLKKLESNTESEGGTRERLLAPKEKKKRTGRVTGGETELKAGMPLVYQLTKMVAARPRMPGGRREALKRRITAISESDTTRKAPATIWRDQGNMGRETRSDSPICATGVPVVCLAWPSLRRPPPGGTPRPSRGTWGRVFKVLPRPKLASRLNGQKPDWPCHKLSPQSPAQCCRALIL